MKYSNKQIKCILRIQEFVETANMLSRMYNEFDDKELSVANITDKSRIYKIYCSSIYNLIDAIKKSEYLFGECKKYPDFKNIINKEFIANGDKYYAKGNYKSNFYKIIKTIRDQVNHYTRGDEDDNMLFEIYIDFKAIEELRLIVNDIFYEIYNKLERNKIESIVLSRPKIKYSIDKMNDRIDLIEKKCNESTNEIDKAFSKENIESIQILKDYFDPNNLFKLLNKDKDAEKKYNKMDNRIDELFEQELQYVDSNGTDLQKEAVNLIKDFISKDTTSKNDYDNNLKKLTEDLTKLAEKKNKNE